MRIERIIVSRGQWRNGECVTFAAINNIPMKLIKVKPHFKSVHHTFCALIRFVRALHLNPTR